MNSLCNKYKRNYNIPNLSIFGVKKAIINGFSDGTEDKTSDTRTGDYVIDQGFSGQKKLHHSRRTKNRRYNSKNRMSDVKQPLIDPQ